MLRSYHWPGNVRELEHAVERAVIMSTTDVLRPADFALPGMSLGPRPAGGASSFGGVGSTPFLGGTGDRRTPRDSFGEASLPPVNGSHGNGSDRRPATSDDLDFGFDPTFSDSDSGSDLPCLVLHTLDVRAAEQSLIQEALRMTGGNRTRASELLGINPRTLRNKLNGR